MSLVKIGDAYFERSEIAVVLPRTGDTLVFLRSGKSVGVDATLSSEQLTALLKELDSQNTNTNRKD